MATCAYIHICICIEIHVCMVKITIIRPLGSIFGDCVWGKKSTLKKFFSRFHVSKWPPYLQNIYKGGSLYFGGTGPIILSI